MKDNFCVHQRKKKFLKIISVVIVKLNYCSRFFIEVFGINFFGGFMVNFFLFALVVIFV